MKTVSLKKALELYGAENIEIHNNYKYRSGFFEKDGQLYYFSKDLEGNWPMMCRTAKHRKDYTGGINLYIIENWLENHGFKLKINPLKCDYNSL